MLKKARKEKKEQAGRMLMNPQLQPATYRLLLVHPAVFKRLKIFPEGFFQIHIILEPKKGTLQPHPVGMIQQRKRLDDIIYVN